MFILMILGLSALLLMSNHDLSLTKDEDMKQFFPLYIDWLDHSILNVRHVTGAATKVDWLPG